MRESVSNVDLENENSQEYVKEYVMFDSQEMWMFRVLQERLRVKIEEGFLWLLRGIEIRWLIEAYGLKNFAITPGP